MTFKLVILFAIATVACAQYYPHAGYYGHSPTLTSQSSNILRSYGNLGQVAHQQKTITTPYSSVTKSDVRVSNPGIYAHAAYAAPATYAHAAYAAPAAYAHAPVVRAGLLGVAYSPATHVSRMSYTAPLINYGW